MLLLYKKIVEAMWEVAENGASLGERVKTRTLKPKGAAPRRNSLLHPPRAKSKERVFMTPDYHRVQAGTRRWNWI